MTTQKTDTGTVIFVSTIVALYSTGHWIGATVLAVILIVTNIA